MLSLPAEDGAAQPEALESARAVLASLDVLDGAAREYLRASPGWPYGEDMLLWILLVQSDNVRFCYRQASVNDEQVIGFARRGGEWELTGPDPRFRGP